MQRRVRPASAFILCILLGGLAFGQSPRPLSVDPDQATSGDLLWISDSGKIPLPVSEIAIDLRISGIVVDGTLVQEFHNPTTETIEVLYVFPLPDDAAVYGMEMRIGDRRIVAEVQEKHEARQTYEEARREGRRAALVDQHRPNLFTTSAANVGPGERIRVELLFLQKATRVGDEYRLRFPLAVTPRFSPESHDGLPSSNHVSPPEARVRIDLRRGVELESFESTSHRLELSETARSWILEPSGGSVPADRDLLLAWRPARSALPQVASFVETREGEHYALVMLVPPATTSALGKGLPTETLFVIDVSGSMNGPSIRQARQALLRALDRLRVEDRFNILKFNGESEAFAQGFQGADSSNLQRARAWVSGLEAGGGTAIYPALDRALSLIGDGSSGIASRVIFLTDGAVANEQEVLRAIADRIGSTRLHTIGIGGAPNAWLMRKMARHGRGICEFVATTDETDNRIDSFFDRLERPVWTDLSLTWDGMNVDGVAPAPLPDLHADEPLVLTARLDGPGGKLTVGGWSVEGWTERTADLGSAGPDDSGIARTWARAQVATLMDSLREGADAAHVRQQVVELGLSFHLVTAYTSLVAVESFVGELGDGNSLLADFPQTGTSEPVKRLLAVLLASAGLLGLAGLRRGL